MSLTDRLRAKLASGQIKKEVFVKYEADVNTSSEGKILLDMDIRYDDGMRSLLTRYVVDTTDHAVKAALEKLGWVSPEEAKRREEHLNQVIKNLDYCNARRKEEADAASKAVDELKAELTVVRGKRNDYWNRLVQANHDLEKRTKERDDANWRADERLNDHARVCREFAEFRKAVDSTVPALFIPIHPGGVNRRVTVDDVRRMEEELGILREYMARIRGTVVNYYGAINPHLKAADIVPTP